MEKGLKNIEVFVIESNVLMRRILSKIIQKEEGVSILGSCGDYDFERVSEKIDQFQPDLLFIGIDRTETEEMRLFYRLRNAYPQLHIVLLTPLNAEGAKVALQGVRNGAIDYVTKPEKNMGVVLADKHFHKRVIPLLKVIPKLNRNRGGILSSISDRTISKEFFDSTGDMNPASIELIVIGSCMGGLSTIYQILSALPENLSVPIIIVHHMPKIYTDVLSKDLNEISRLTVKEAKNNTVLIPGTVYIAPGGFHSVIKNEGGRKRIMLHKGPREHKCRPSIDVLLRSAVQEYGGRLIGIYLSGAGIDGVLGALRILEHGGTVLVESEESALISELAYKVKFLNSEIRDVPADSMAEEIIKEIESANKYTTDHFIEQGLNSSNRFKGTIEA